MSSRELNCVEVMGRAGNWQIGGPHIPFTEERFGGTSAVEYGPILASFYPPSNGQPQYILENFHRTLPNNPCPAFKPIGKSGGSH
jgi:hypothetical protein